VIAVGVGVLVLSERFGWAEGLGAVLMFGAAAIALRRPAASGQEKKRAARLPATRY
jgi:drug/metabolite transporter (DMT)-like permease